MPSVSKSLHLLDLPAEIPHMILLELADSDDGASLHAVSQTSHLLYELATPVLYRRFPPRPGTDGPQFLCFLVTISNRRDLADHVRDIHLTTDLFRSILQRDAVMAITRISSTIGFDREKFRQTWHFYVSIKHGHNRPIRSRCNMGVAGMLIAILIALLPRLRRLVIQSPFQGAVKILRRSVACVSGGRTLQPIDITVETKNADPDFLKHNLDMEKELFESNEILCKI